MCQVSVQCAEVQHSQERRWWRLVGRCHDLHLWQPDYARAPPPLPQHPEGNLKCGLL